MASYVLQYRIPRPTGSKPVYALPYPHGMGSDIERIEAPTLAEAQEFVAKFLASKPSIEYDGVVYPTRYVSFLTVEEAPLPGLDRLKL